MYFGGGVKMEAEKIEDLEKRRIPDLEEDEELKRVQVMLPEKILKRLKKMAFEKEVSRGSIIREAIKEYLRKREKPLEENPEAKIPNSKLQDLIDECRTFWGGFETVGEEGFFEKFREKGWKFKDLTDEQFIILCHYLKIGYQGFFMIPEVEDFVDCIRELEATEEQCKLLSLILEYNVEIEDKDLDKAIEELISEIEERMEELKED